MYHRSTALMLRGEKGKAMPSEALVPLVIIAGFFVASLLVVLIMIPKGRKVAQIVVQEGEPFDLQARPLNEKSYRVWLRYKVRWTGVAGFGVACRIRAMVDDRLVFDEVVGAGYAVEGMQRTKKAGMRYFSVSSGGRGSSGGSETASIILGETGERPLGTPITVTGEVRTAEATTVKWLKVYIAK